ncbi:hypothetical protein RI367_003359 [Sorochytrium milnesiophthora]
MIEICCMLCGATARNQQPVEIKYLDEHGAGYTVPAADVQFLGRICMFLRNGSFTPPGINGLHQASILLPDTEENRLKFREADGWRPVVGSAPPILGIQVDFGCLLQLVMRNQPWEDNSTNEPDGLMIHTVCADMLRYEVERHQMSWPRLFHWMLSHTSYDTQLLPSITNYGMPRRTGRGFLELRRGQEYVLDRPDVFPDMSATSRPTVALHTKVAPAAGLLELLPLEVAEAIMRYLPLGDLLALQAVSRPLQQLVTAANIPWKAACRRFGYLPHDDTRHPYLNGLWYQYFAACRRSQHMRNRRRILSTIDCILDGVHKTSMAVDPITEIEVEAAAANTVNPITAPVEPATVVEARRADARSDIPPLKAHEQMDISFQDINYEIEVGSGKKKAVRHILKDVSAKFGRGRLTVILGASGAGKTSLLNVVAGETKLGVLTGSLFINGQPSTGTTMKEVSAFVHQDDVVLGTMTVQEAITMSSRLRLPTSLSDTEKDQKVDEIIRMLGLTRCRNTIFGTATEKGTSGGERKRACMAMELITNPSIVFLDEPTSGLDTYTAYAVVKLLKDLAVSGRTIIATLHQPSSEIFHLIDDLCIMSQGEIMYYGEAKQAISYFSELGYKCPQYSNPADFIFMDVLNSAGGTKAKAEKEAERMKGLLKQWKNGPRNQAMMKTIQASSGGAIGKDHYKYHSPVLTQYKILLRRTFKNAIRDKMVVRVKLIQMIVMGLLLGVIYVNIPSRKYQSQSQDRSGLIFTICSQMIMSNAMGMVTSFSAQKQVFQREFGAGYYGLPAYFLSKQVVELPFQIALPFVFIVVLYWIAGFVSDAPHFFTMAAFVIVMAGCGTAIGTFAACLFESLTVTLAVLPTVMLPMMIFGGLLVNTGNIPAWLNWIKYLSPQKYGFTGMVKSEFAGVGQFCPSSSDTPQVIAAGCTPTSTVITSLGLDDQGDVWTNFGILVGLWMGLLLLSYCALWRVVARAKRVDFSVKSGATAAAAAQ